MIADIAISEVHAALDEGTEYFVFNLVISNMKTVGTSSCDGCRRGARLAIPGITLKQPAGVGDFYISGAANTSGVWYLDWQGGATDPVRNTTWGGVKALYH